MGKKPCQQPREKEFLRNNGLQSVSQLTFPSMKALSLPIIFLLLGGATLLTSCGNSEPNDEAATSEREPTLAEVFADNFRVGAALNAATFTEENQAGARVTAEQFNTITPENDLKWVEIQPGRDSMDWGPADAFVEFGEKNDMFIVGHALVWYQQIADYVGETKDPEEMRAILREHINAVAGRYKGRIDAWDVLNEAIDDEGQGALRAWSVPDVLGPDYVTEVFKMAREAAPDAELYYNDYNAWQPEKRAGMVRMLKRALENGAPIDGIGIQGHYHMAEPSLAQIEAAIEDLGQFGLPLMFTEVDLNVLPNPYSGVSADPRLSFENTPFMNPYPDPNALPDSVQQAFTQRYVDIWKLFLKHDDKISRVTFWGVGDEDSWLNNWPVKGRTNYPLFFDRQYQKKPVYDAILALGQEGAAVTED